MHPVLGRLRLGNLDEEHPRPHAIGVDDGIRRVRIRPVDPHRVERVVPVVEAGRRRLLDVAQDLAPEAAQTLWARGIERDLK
jgi:hypothetical protein